LGEAAAALPSLCDRYGRLDQDFLEAITADFACLQVPRKSDEIHQIAAQFPCKSLF